jgi:general secretion pathway protein A
MPSDRLMSAENMSAMLAQRDARTAELEAAIRELQAIGGADYTGSDSTDPFAADPSVKTALAQIETRLEEHEQSLRHVLAMLIEWLEGDASRKAA